MITGCLFNFLALVGLAAAWVELDPKLVPPVAEPLPLLSLGRPSFLPEELLKAIVGNSATGPVNFTKGDGSDTKIYVYDGEDIVGYIDGKTGETRVFPDYTAIKAANSTLDIKKAVDFFKRGSDYFPADDTLLELVKGSSLVGSTLFESPGDSEGIPESTYLTLATVQRSIKAGGTTYPVCGPGSQATFGVGPGNKVLSVSYTWKPAKQSGRTIKSVPTDEIVKRIRKALSFKLRDTEGINVYHVDACFYDSGLKFMQPVYRVFGQAFVDGGKRPANATQILRYFPVGDITPEDVIPQGPLKDVEPPIQPDASNLTARSFDAYGALNPLHQRGIKPKVTVGRYVTRNDTFEGEFLANANVFWKNLASSSTIDFINSQYYWAYPWLYGSSANSFVNSVNVALTESHGAFHLFSTFADSGGFDAVSIPSGLPAGGYGPGIKNDGHLAYWLINSCEVIPARIDFEALHDPAPKRRAFDPWWPVFRGGLHAVVGWRTSPFFSDNVAVNTAAAMALGRPVASAWLDAAHADPAFNGRPTYVGHGTGITQPNGRAAVIYPCGRGSDKVWQVENLGKPTCLEMRYYNND